MDEADFLTEVLDQTGAWLLLNVENVYANAPTIATTLTAFWTVSRWSGSPMYTLAAVSNATASTTIPTHTKHRLKC